MALTWREVAAPKLDTRDLAYAGQTIGASFDKLGDMFVKREEGLRTEATDAAIARILAAASPEEAQRLMQEGNMGRRVDMRRLMEAGVQHKGVLQDQAIKGHTLFENDAERTWGGKKGALELALMEGNEQEAARLQAEIAADERGSFLLGKYSGDLAKAKDTRFDNVEGQRASMASEANQRAQVGVAQGQLALARQKDARDAADWNMSRTEREQARRDAATADGFIQRYTRTPGVNMMAPQEQLLRLKQTPTWDTMPRSQRALIEAGLTARAEERQALPDYLASAGANTQLSRLLGGLSRTEVQAGDLNQRIERDAYRSNPSAEIIGRSRDKKYEGASPATVAAFYDKLGYNAWNRYGAGLGNQYLTKGYLEKLMNGPQGLPAPVVQAALEHAMHSPWGGSADKVKATLDQLVIDYYDQGETRKTELNIATAKAPVQAVLADKAQVEQQARAFYAQYPGQKLPKELAEAQQRVNARMDAVVKKYTEAQESSRTK